MSKLLFLFALGVVFQQVCGLKVTVYYESLCPDSIRFVTRQLYPTSKQLSFTTEFVPYGKAQHRTNPWAIRCQHGVNECLGNAVQACALSGIKNNSDQMEFVNCVMSSQYPPTAGKACAQSIGYDYKGVAACSTGTEGQHLLADFGDKTHSLQPSLSFVPTIIFNDVYDSGIQNLALTNLARAICSYDATVTGCSTLFKRN